VEVAHAALGNEALSDPVYGWTLSRNRCRVFASERDLQVVAEYKDAAQSGGRTSPRPVVTRARGRGRGATFE